MTIATELIELFEMGFMPGAVHEYGGALQSASDDDIEELFERLAASDRPLEGGHEGLLAEILRHLVQRSIAAAERDDLEPLAALTLSHITELYGRVPCDAMSRGLLLQLLAVTLDEPALEQFTFLLVNDPPTNSRAVMVALSPLFQRRGYPANALFPELLEALARPVTAAPVLDLANYLFREGLVTKHPAADRQMQLIGLLGELASRLARIEDQPQAAGGREVAEQIDDSVSLAVSLCDSLALLGAQEAIGKLYQASELRHRRIRAEAAAALAVLGEEAGESSLIELASESVVRLRVLAYAEELNILDKVDAQYRTPGARAEADLALWLSQPTQLGFPPTTIEAVDNRSLYWPGFDDEVDCFLFRFTYVMGPQEYSNIGIAGPVTHAFAADLADLPPDDIYAAFAGWHVEHDEIFETSCNEVSMDHLPEIARLERRLRDAGYDAIQPIILGSFLGDHVLVANATLAGKTGIAIGDHQDTQWVLTEGRLRPLNPQDAYCIYKGRRMLRAFN